MNLGQTSCALLALLLSCLATARPLAAQDPTPATKAKYTEVAVENGGTIKGRVTFKGETPKLTLSINQDRAHCSHDDTGMRPSPRLTVATDGGVQHAVIYLKDVPQGKPLADMKFTARLDQKDCTYEPFVQVIPFKEKLTISNTDPLNHNVHAKLGDKSLFNFAQPNVGEMTKAITWPGIISVNCDVHMWMNAYVFSVRHPYYAVTDETGAFELPDVPAGEHEVALWHAGWNATPVTNPEGQTTGYKYDEPVMKTVKVTVAAGATSQADFVLND